MNSNHLRWPSKETYIQTKWQPQRQSSWTSASIVHMQQQKLVICHWSFSSPLSSALTFLKVLCIGTCFEMRNLQLADFYKCTTKFSKPL